MRKTAINILLLSFMASMAYAVSIVGPNTTKDLPDSSDRRYVTDAQKSAIGSLASPTTSAAVSALSGTNTGDESQGTIKSKLGPATDSVDGYTTAADHLKFNSSLLQTWAALGGALPITNCPPSPAALSIAAALGFDQNHIFCVVYPQVLVLTGSVSYLTMGSLTGSGGGSNALTGSHSLTALGNLTTQGFSNFYANATGFAALAATGSLSASFSSSTTFSDTFARANGGLGANWTTVTGESAPTISSNAVIGSSSTGNAAYWSANAFTNDQCSQIQLSAWTGSTSVLGVTVNTSPSADTYYKLWANGATNYTITKVVNGTPLGLIAYGYVPTVNDVIKLCRQGNTLVPTLNGTVYSAVTDTAISGGNPGIYIYGNSASNSLDNWVGTTGTLAYPSGLAELINTGTIIGSSSSSGNAAITGVGEIAALGSLVGYGAGNATLTGLAEAEVLGSVTGTASGGGGGITFVGAGPAVISSGSTVAVTLPSGVQAGDTIFVIGDYGAAQTVNSVTGYTSIHTYCIYVKIAGASEPNPTANTSGSGAYAIALVFRGASQTASHYKWLGIGSGGSGSFSPSTTTYSNSTVLINFDSGNTSTSYDPGTVGGAGAYTFLVNDTSTGAHYWEYSKTQATIGTPGAFTWTTLHSTEDVWAIEIPTSSN